MLRYIIRRLLQSLLLLFAISLISFGLIRLAPGGPEDFFLNDAALIGNSPEAIEAMRQSIREQYGLNDPFVLQYARWSVSLLRLDFGRSIITHQSSATNLDLAKTKPSRSVRQLS